MYNDKREDSFNAWIRTEGCHKRNLHFEHATDEECWIVTIEHKNPAISCVNEQEVLAFLKYANSEGYINRHWYEDIYDEHLYKVGRKLAFCYNA